MRGRSRVVMAIVFSLIAAAGIGSWLYSRALPQPYTGPVDQIIIGNIGEYSIFNIIAQENGYFRENGLDAKVIEYDSGPSAIADLLAGKTDVAVAAEFVGVMRFFKDPSLKILTEASRHKVFHVVARADKGIANPVDLKGKRVGVTRKGAGEFYLGRFLAFNGLGLRDIAMIDLPPDEMVKQLRMGELDAAVIFDPHAYDLEKELGSAVTSWSAQGEQNTFALTYSSDAFINAHPEVIERYLSALQRAEQYVKEHPAEAQDLIARLLNYDPAYVRYMWQNFSFAQGLDQELLLTMEDQARWVIDNRLTDSQSVPNYLNFIYFDAMEKIRPDAVKIIK